MKTTFKVWQGMKNGRSNYLSVMTWKTADRLRFYRSKAEKSKTENAKDWRYWKRQIFQAPNNARSDDGRKIYTDDVDQYGDYLGDTDKLLPYMRDAGGFYADNSWDSVITGGVTKLRCPLGTLYIPVTSCTGWDGTIHYVGDAELVGKGASEDEHDEAIKEAARYALHYAEKEAEEAREYDAKDQAEQQIEAAREEIHGINKAALPLLKAIKAEGKNFSMPVCSALRAHVQDLLSERAKQFRLIEDRSNNFWSAVEY